jgi:murein L,D-transpeptidase YcbB/YkuD
VKTTSGVGKTLILALFSVAVTDCGSKPSVQPKQVEATSLQSLVSDPLVRRFYEARQWRAAWDKQSEKELLDAIAQAPANGLRVELFLKNSLPTDPSAREAALTKAALGYAAALAHGYVDPTKVSAIYTIPRPKSDEIAGLSQALQHGNVGAWLGSLPPQTDEYRALSQAYVGFLKQATAARSAQVPGGKPIKPGQADPRIPQLVAALIANGYLNAPPKQQGQQQARQRYAGAMIGAVRQLQADYGINPNGVITADTLAVLNGGAGYRARQLAVALERLRWLERNPPATRIDVNTAASFLDYWRDGAHQLQLRVINGQPDKWTTPQIQAPIFQLVANPMWRVPDRIVDDELSKKSAAYLSANGFSWRDGRLVQLPGPKNSLGQVKFDMRDPQQIYLHDTPFKSWFAVNNRHRSHGCVRVQNALDFAFQLASEDGVQDKFQEALASGDENYVMLKREIPVRLLYHTAFWDGRQVQFVPDVYGWDEDVARPLGLEHGPPRVTYQRQEDIGP